MTGYPDMAPVLRELRSFIDERSMATNVEELGDFDRAVFAKTVGLSLRGRGQAEVLVAREVAVELGHPQTASAATVATTFAQGLVETGRISRIGPDLDEISGGYKCPYAQIVCLQLEEGASPDPFKLETTQFLFNRLPGYMVRSVPGRLWARVSHEALRREMTLNTVGQALVTAFFDDFPEVRAAEVVFVTSSKDDVEALGPLVIEAQALTGRHKKLLLDPDGELECSELSCEDCDEKPVCDAVREVLARRRRDR